jgi:hypothetical protein
VASAGNPMQSDLHDMSATMRSGEGVETRPRRGWMLSAPDREAPWMAPIERPWMARACPAQTTSICAGVRLHHLRRDFESNRKRGNARTVEAT